MSERIPRSSGLRLTRRNLFEALQLIESGRKSSTPRGAKLNGYIPFIIIRVTPRGCQLAGGEKSTRQNLLLDLPLHLPLCLMMMSLTKRIRRKKRLPRCLKVSQSPQPFFFCVLLSLGSSGRSTQFTLSGHGRDAAQLLGSFGIDCLPIRLLNTQTRRNRSSSLGSLCM